MFPESQLIEIALALENMKIPFIWVIKNNFEDDWMPDGFKKMVVESKRGLVIKDWAPQVDILNHPAIGGYVTHCGWNSVTENVMAGVPMITWPLFAEQFYNEKLITQCVLMNGEELRKKAKEVGKMCARAVEDGRSSLQDLVALIEEVKAFGK
ncbi:UDP-glycosyltransferase 73C5 [Heracleum sosnowskyi]|uniref:UDP-glycosyltransferase 73C5 n=1 Tax=Heracleum sosnowskyi TaxID=360622 RepID=A0AAD8HV85_9APIA|nr:UDP-glycosyltransferase 73C5 [Heracleum sosnowskyi]